MTGRLGEVEQARSVIDSGGRGGAPWLRSWALSRWLPSRRSGQLSHSSVRGEKRSGGRARACETACVGEKRADNKTQRTENAQLLRADLGNPASEPARIYRGHGLQSARTATSHARSVVEG